MNWKDKDKIKFILILINVLQTNFVVCILYAQTFRDVVQTVIKLLFSSELMRVGTNS